MGGIGLGGGYRLGLGIVFGLGFIGGAFGLGPGACVPGLGICEAGINLEPVLSLIRMKLV